MSVYDYKVKDNKGNEVALSKYEGKVLLIINSATGCGFTPQYDDLQDMYELYQARGFEILDFPCNQFANQAPGSDEEIESFCTGRYGITFPLFHKINVNGEDAEPLFEYLKQAQGFANKSFKMKMLGMLSKTGKTNDIRWNFTKFLVDKEGNVVARFEPTDSMDMIKEKVEELL